MARKTKEEALATRNGILDAAARLFMRQGVSRTTLQEVAVEAGVTRGAIYWHFEDKAAMFNALMERAKLPLESAMATLERPDSDDPLGDLREYARCVFRLTVRDEAARGAIAIALLKLEYNEEMIPVLERRQQNMARWRRLAQQRLRQAAARGELREGVKVRAAALGLWALMEGLIRNWLIAPEFDLLRVGMDNVDIQLRGIGTDGSL
jgi:TetR/AcrR family acrAB operon transcriptional repressor